MRLIELKSKIDFAYENFDLKLSNSNGSYFIENVLKCKDAIGALIDSHILPSGYEKEDVFISIIQSSFTSRIIVDNATYNSFLAISNRIKYMLGCLHGWMTKYIDSEETDTTINIKLPKLKKLEDFSIIINLLESSLNEISKIHGGNEVVIERVDHGSIWIAVAVGTAFKFIVKALKDAFDIAQKKVELDQAKELLKRTKLENKAIENFSAVQEAFTNALLDEYSSKITAKDEKEVNGLTKSERTMRYKKALKELTQLISSGTEFHPALLASQEIINAFPKFHDQIALKAPIAELPRNNDKEVNDSEKIKDKE